MHVKTLRVFENIMLGRIFGAQRDEVMRENYLMKIITVCTHCLLMLG